MIVTGSENLGQLMLEELQNQALQFPIRDRWRLVQLLLSSIQQETLTSSASNSSISALTELDPWTQSLIGVVHLETEDQTESYVDYLEEKYR